MIKDKLIIYSGGMDSTVLLHEYKDSIALAVSFYYGQKHFKESDYAEVNTNYLKIPFMKIDISRAFIHIDSALLRKNYTEIPEGHYTDDSMKSTIVPFRNGIMLSIAAGIAETHNLDTLLIANHAGDHAIYPDCRVPFMEAMANAIRAGTTNHVTIFAPYTLMDKRYIALRGEHFGVDFATTWSCYNGREFHCGKCGTCVERKEALKDMDPTWYEKEEADGL